jgi:hypothetical protein
MPATAKRTLIFGIICVASLIAFVVMVQVQQLIGSKASNPLSNFTSVAAKECIKLTNKNSCTKNSNCSWKSSGNTSIGFCVPKEIEKMIPTQSSTNSQGQGSNQESIKTMLDRAGVNTDYSPWAIWFTGTNISNEYKARVTYNGHQAGTLLSIVVSPDGKGGSFQIPKDTFLPSCGQSTCTYGLQLVGTRNYSNIVTFTAPGK